MYEESLSSSDSQNNEIINTIESIKYESNHSDHDDDDVNSISTDQNLLLLTENNPDFDYFSSISSGGGYSTISSVGSELFNYNFD